MSVVEETPTARLGRRARRGAQILTSPTLLREQIEYLRHGPAPGTPPVEPTLRFPADPWHPLTESQWRSPAVCNICRWSGEAFDGARHVEFQLCPRCGSSARDRFLLWCFTTRTPRQPWLRVLETSPRMGAPYREAMGAWFTYAASDYDERAHRAMLRIDLQAIDLPDAAVDVLLTPHVLEHVPDTDAALEEILRVLAPGGRMYLQVPILQGFTAPPTEPEFHGDQTPVFWRFGFDLTERLRDHGFTATVLCTQPFSDAARRGDAAWSTDTAPEFDVASMLGGVVPEDLRVVLSQRRAERLGLWNAYQFLTFECVRHGRGLAGGAANAAGRLRAHLRGTFAP
ncbi:MAG: class I SAM-dependent methyltransferase [Acidimicrobiales bacterium]|jgi:SAM-dependent methyltransferase|nr:class I SAM-dependent methyltransferase [Acidimicrobiales bacterium]